MHGDEKMTALQPLEETPLQRAARLNQTAYCIELLVKKENPNDLGNSKITPLLWAASHSNKLLVAVLILFGAKINTVRYPELSSLFSRQAVAAFPEIKSIASMCPIKLMKLIDHSLFSRLLPSAIQTQRLRLKACSTPRAKLFLYLNYRNPAMFPDNAKESVKMFLYCLNRHKICSDTTPIIINFIHAYSFNWKN